MWKTQLNRAISEVRFVLKPDKMHHPTWKFVQHGMMELKLLNQSTFFCVEEIPDEFETPSAIHFLYGDLQGTEDMVETAGLSSKALEKVFKEKVAYGLSLKRRPVLSNLHRSLPTDIVDSQAYTYYIHDSV